MFEPLYKRVVPIPELLVALFPDYKKIEVVLEDAKESFYKDTLRGAIRVTLIPRNMELPCEILTVITPKVNSLDKAAAFVDRLAENERFLIDSLEGCTIKIL